MAAENNFRRLCLGMYRCILELQKSAKSKDIVEAREWNDKFTLLYKRAVKFLPPGANPSDNPLFHLFDLARNKFMMSLTDISGEIDALKSSGKGHLIELYEQQRMQSLEEGRELISKIKSTLKSEDFSRDVAA